ncbi:hypothetical protein [Rhodopseudomonas sp. BR0G17]|uniref:hypothetical protein n=1 Tax=Rhodopseudomonas sp. BR0G17 TaxID=2269368 RepID=UPI0013DFF29B|nr:hypothetical protein [Rhodopseudomonas sp. BR0G17]NEW98521.1 hypothetical protein [Rhodopseudomonas sp. BR0G17]
MALSVWRQVDGVLIGGWSRNSELFDEAERALNLIKKHSPLDHARIVRELDRIWVNLSFHGLAEYVHSLKACVLDERFLADPVTTTEQIASTIVHEATHARIERYGIAYEEDRRARIEAICFRRELAFIARLPDQDKLRDEIEKTLSWYANSDEFSDCRLEARYVSGGVEALAHLGMPNWLIRAVIFGREFTVRVKKLVRRTE